MLWLSALLVFGAVGVIGVNLASQESGLQVGFEQMIHARVPWLVVGTLWAGMALGVVALVRRRTRLRSLVLALETPFVGFFSWYFLVLSFLPASALAVDVGDPFPAYQLVDQDDAPAHRVAGEPRPPALYIFYRGDW